MRAKDKDALEVELIIYCVKNVCITICLSNEKNYVRVLNPCGLQYPYFVIMNHMIAYIQSINKSKDWTLDKAYFGPRLGYCMAIYISIEREHAQFKRCAIAFNYFLIIYFIIEISLTKQ